MEILKLKNMKLGSKNKLFGLCRWSGNFFPPDIKTAEIQTNLLKMLAGLQISFQKTEFMTNIML